MFVLEIDFLLHVLINDRKHLGKQLVLRLKSENACLRIRSLIRNICEGLNYELGDPKLNSLDVVLFVVGPAILLRQRQDEGSTCRMSFSVSNSGGEECCGGLLGRFDQKTFHRIYIAP